MTTLPTSPQISLCTGPLVGKLTSSWFLMSNQNPFATLGIPSWNLLVFAGRPLASSHPTTAIDLRRERKPDGKLSKLYVYLQMMASGRHR